MKLIPDWIRFARGARELPTPPPRAAGGSSSMLWLQAGELPSSQDYVKLSEEGYRRCAIAYACVEEIASSVADAPLIVRDNAGEIVKSGELWGLLQSPNPDQSEIELRHELATHLGIAGEFFVWIQRDKGGRPARLWALRPDRVSVEIGKDGLIRGSADDKAGYRYKVDYAGEGRFIPAADIIHLRKPDPTNDYRGLSPISVAARMIDMDNNTSDFVRAIFEHGFPGGIIKVKGRADDDQRNRLRMKWDQLFSGPKGMRGTAVLDEDADWTKIGFDPKDADVSGIFGITETRICMVFGVPPVLIGSRVGLEFATYSNFAGARRSFWEETMMPLYRRLTSVMNRGIAAEFGQSISYDLGAVVALQEDANSRWARADKGWENGTLTKNEVRALKGLPLDQNGDVYRAGVADVYEPANIIEQQAAKTPRRLEAA